MEQTKEQKEYVAYAEAYAYFFNALQEQGFSREEAILIVAQFDHD